MTYATTNEVRAEAGFTGNPNVTNETVNRYLIMGNSIVNSALSARYNISTLTGDNFTNSPAEQFLKTCEILISAGLLLQKEYGIESADTDKGGRERIKQGKDMLMQLFDTDTPIYLIGVDGSRFPFLTKSSAGSISVSAVTGPPFFSVDQQW